MFKKWPFSRHGGAEDYSNYFGDIPLTQKQSLIEKCKKHDVCIYVDDVSETSAGFYDAFRGVASEAELQRRLDAKTVVVQAQYANRIALVALVVAFAAFLKSFFFA